MRYEITLNGQVYEVDVDDNRARLGAVTEAAPRFVERPATPLVASKLFTAQPGEPVLAPMPGLVIDIRVQPGQRVAAGQVLVVLEALKMENEIVSPRDAVVAEIVAVRGQTVKSGATLLTLE